MASRKCDSMKQLYYVPTITSQKYVRVAGVEGITVPKTNFHVDIYENKGNADKKLIGTASIVLGPPHNDSVLYIRVETKYEHTTCTGSVCHHMTIEEAKAEHEEIVVACKELKKAWG